ncbi:MAG: exosortase C-terminal domain/associated protein EpsI [Pseudomonadota bacterium]
MAPDSAYPVSVRVQVGAMFVALAVLLGVAFWPSIAWVSTQWAAGGVVGHGYLVAAISAWLLWRARAAIVASVATPGWWSLLAVLALSAFWLLGYVANVVAVQTIALPAIWWFCVVAVFGYRTGIVTAFAIAYLYCALPALDMTQPFFQSVTSAAVGVALSIVGIPALLQGNHVMLPGGDFEIAEGCAGLSYLLAGVSVALLYAHLYYRRWLPSIVLLAVIILLSMIGNWVRVLIIIAIGHYAGMDHPMVADHLSLGWIIFAVTILPALFFAQRFEKKLPVSRSNIGNGADRARWPALVVTACVALAGPLWAWQATSEPQREDALVLKLPAVTGWQGPARARASWQPTYTGVQEQLLQRYTSAGKDVLVYANVYFSQSQDRELIYFSNDIAGDWRRTQRKKNEVQLIAGAFGPVRELSARGVLGEWLIWYRYDIDGQAIAGAREAKFAQALAVLRGKPAAGVIAFATKCDASCDSARDVLREFAAGFEYNLPQLVAGKDDHADL